MRAAAQQITGQRFGRLSVIRQEGWLPNGKDRTRGWLCVCDCGRETVTTSTRLKSGATTSCGCFVVEAARATRKLLGGPVRHGHSHSPTYRSWYAMRQRCENRKNKRFEIYGGRGISVCERWKLFDNFLEDMGARPEGKTLDRIDCDGNYEPANCRWATASEQMKNRRPFNRSSNRKE